MKGNQIRFSPNLLWRFQLVSPLPTGHSKQDIKVTILEKQYKSDPDLKRKERESFLSENLTHFVEV